MVGELVIGAEGTNGKLGYYGQTKMSESTTRQTTRNFMALPAFRHRSLLCLRASHPWITPTPIILSQRRSFFNFLKKSTTQFPKQPVPLLTEDNLFHPLSKSPIPAIRARGEAIKGLAPCPICSSHHEPDDAHIDAKEQTGVKFECPDCGWPTHCSEEHWKADEEHSKYCKRLKEANEDEHDLRSGRRMREFELPGSFRVHVIPWLAHET